MKLTVNGNKSTKLRKTEKIELALQPMEPSTPEPVFIRICVKDENDINNGTLTERADIHTWGKN